MAGKSTYMRQTALIVLMAQMGSFVPAKSATIGIVDRVFTRIGASDDLASGQSTFMVEMNEMANIIRHATGASLLILDEIGRGTSTFDGMAIARAVVEYCADKRKLGAKTMFATHYHELSALEGELSGVRNYNITAKKQGGTLVFLRKIVPGAADDSYGIEVAKLAGLPDAIITKAKGYLKELESGGTAAFAPAHGADSDDQITLADVGADEVREQLRTTDLNTLTPIEAMNLLFELQKKGARMMDGRNERPVPNLHSSALTKREAICACWRICRCTWRSCRFCWGGSSRRGRSPSRRRSFALYAVGVIYMLVVAWDFLRRDFYTLCDRPFFIIIEVIFSYGMMLMFNFVVSMLLSAVKFTDNPNNNAVARWRRRASARWRRWRCSSPHGGGLSSVLAFSA